jgi:hypothetical protein
MINSIYEKQLKYIKSIDNDNLEINMIHHNYLIFNHPQQK